MHDAVAHHAALDRRMIAAARGIRVLALASWPASVQRRFLDEAMAGRLALPRVAYPPQDFSDARRELDAVAGEADPSHPLGIYLVDSARQWSIAAELVEALGTPAVCTHSLALYGGPAERLPGSELTARDAARHFIGIADEFDTELIAPHEQVEISATALQLWLQGELDQFFAGRVVQVELDPELIAKAAAGAYRIRLRSSAAYTDYDRHQLLQHEALVHSLTALNGREQPVLGSLAMSSPRITTVQEGLATLAEQITGNIDIERLKRIGLRIEAVALAMDGADFIEVYRYFLDAGQTAAESFASAQRCSAACRWRVAMPSPRTPCTCAG